MNTTEGNQWFPSVTSFPSERARPKLRAIFFGLCKSALSGVHDEPPFRPEMSRLDDMRGIFLSLISAHSIPLFRRCVSMRRRYTDFTGYFIEC